MVQLIQYAEGDATLPQEEGHQIIAHICNNVGAWGAGFVTAISGRWKKPEACYRSWHGDSSFKLGHIQTVTVAPDLTVANMIAQSGLRSPSNPYPIRYDALEKCLEALARVARSRWASVHMPRIGCGLAGGKWEQVEPILERTLVAKSVPVTVYDYKMR